MEAAADEITLQKALVNGLVQARDSISHQIAIEQTKLEQMKEKNRNRTRKALCGSKRENEETT